ncbi:mitochondrial carrier [Polychaeton citri CBS 116435]|uniref:Mitochondrial carrier n=1 Tax=Polychaeton citri CBS 116435 TaxID=1314669 RepID=A0A9P4Q2F8_9PEZI|nr:mitochondrial carrier [Polychaeton citri CBS 116435]
MATMHTQGQRHDRLEGDMMSEPARGGADDARTTSQPAAAEQNPMDMDISIAQKMLSAVSGSVLTSLLVTPLDVVRVRLQAQQGPFPSSRLPPFIQLPPNLGVTACCREVFWVQNQSQFCVASPNAVASVSAPAPVIDEVVISDCAAEETQRRTFNSTLDGLRKIARNEGIWTLWRGLSPTLAMTIPGNVIYFAGYDWLRSNPHSPMAGRISDKYQPLAAGSAARVLAALCVSPIEMLRTRMQATATGEKDIMRATVTGLKEMVSAEGYTSLWRGLNLTMWRDVPFSALYWWGYEYGRERLDEIRKRSQVEDSALQQHNRPSSNTNTELSHRALLADSFMAGAASGAIAAFVTTPFDVGKTRQQTVLHDTTSRLKDLPENRAMPRFLYHIYCTEGMPGLFRGWAARCLKVAPACAIMISSYEIGKKMAVTVREGREAREI